MDKSELCSGVRDGFNFTVSEANDFTARETLDFTVSEANDFTAQRQ